MKYLSVRCKFCPRLLRTNNRSGVCTPCHLAGKAECKECGAACSRSRGVCKRCMPPKPDEPCKAPRGPDHDTRIARYMARAAAGLDLFAGAEGENEPGDTPGGKE